MTVSWIFDRVRKCKEGWPQNNLPVAHQRLSGLPSGPRRRSVGKKTGAVLLSVMLGDHQYGIIPVLDPPSGGAKI